MKVPRPPLIYGLLAVLSVTVGPFLLLTRGNSATSVEKFLYVVSLFPLGLIALQVRYLLGRRALMEAPDPQLRRKGIEMLRQEHKQLVLIVLISALMATTLYAWLIFVWTPTRN